MLLSGSLDLDTVGVDPKVLATSSWGLGVGTEEEQNDVEGAACDGKVGSIEEGVAYEVVELWQVEGRSMCCPTLVSGNWGEDVLQEVEWREGMSDMLEGGDLLERGRWDGGNRNCSSLVDKMEDIWKGRKTKHQLRTQVSI